MYGVIDDCAHEKVEYLTWGGTSPREYLTWRGTSPLEYSTWGGTSCVRWVLFSKGTSIDVFGVQKRRVLDMGRYVLKKPAP